MSCFRLIYLGLDIIRPHAVDHVRFQVRWKEHTSTCSLATGPLPLMIHCVQCELHIDLRVQCDFLSVGGVFTR